MEDISDNLESEIRCGSRIIMERGEMMDKILGFLWNAIYCVSMLNTKSHSIVLTMSFYKKIIWVSSSNRKHQDLKMIFFTFMQGDCTLTSMKLGENYVNKTKQNNLPPQKKEEKWDNFWFSNNNNGNNSTRVIQKKF